MDTHTHNCVNHIEREREGGREKGREMQGEGALVWGFVFVLLIIYIEEVLLGFLPLNGFLG